MKVLSLCLLFAVVSGTFGSAVFWPGAIPLSAPTIKTYIPPQVKSFGYSTSQYINTIPHSYTVKYQPQISYQVPFNAFAPVQGYHTFPPVVTAPYYHPSSLLYHPIAPVGSIIPISATPEPPKEIPQENQPTNQPGDEDTAVIESADNSSNQNQENLSSDSNNSQGFPQIPQQSEQSPPFPQFPPTGSQITESQSPQIPSSQFPSQFEQTRFPPFPQFPQSGSQITESQSPQIPSSQFPPQAGQSPSFPPFVQFPQFGSQITEPQSPQNPPSEFAPSPAFPSQPQGPTSSPSQIFPSGDNADKNFNDEDTVSIESA